MSLPRWAAALVLTLCAIGGPPDRQYYDNWYKPEDAEHWVCRYFFKLLPDAEAYRHHYVVWYPKKPTHFYYFNPDTGLYWCRALSSSRDTEDLWQVLARFDPSRSNEENEQQAVVSAIPDAVWDAKALTHPKIPGPEQKVPMLAPPRPPDL